MPGFNDNLRRAREAAGLSPEALANRVGAAPLWLIHLEAIGASLPELSQLVKLADALNCSVDDLLAGRDDEFDHPRRRHAALIAARLGSVSLLLSALNRARLHHALTEGDEKLVDEAALLVSVQRCRGWVTSPDAEIGMAAALERELDAHIARIAAVCGHAEAGRPAAPPATDTTAAEPAAPAAASATRVPATAAVSLREALSAAGQAPAADGRAARGNGGTRPAVVAPSVPPRPPGHCSCLWTRPSQGPDNYVCEMFTAADGVTVRLACGDRLLAMHPCRTLDEAFGQSSAWKRLPDPESLAAMHSPDGLSA